MDLCTGKTIPTSYARHSQRKDHPGCPPGHNILWSGFSLLHTEDEGRAHVQDLGQPGSCLPKFDPMPFMFCGLNQVCNWGDRTTTSYWLATDERRRLQQLVS